MPPAKRNRRRTAGTHILLRWAVLPAMLAILIAQTAHAAPSAGDELFESKIRPLFLARCQKCHGGEKQESGLRLDSQKSAFTGGDSGPAVVAGQPDDSELVK